ncbi:hypothetical protein D082_14900 [Synechocystis sp. PCC 6714]|nr:hypothetical protein D082_14900 [Synechocystis sp. PCC 6714]
MAIAYGQETRFKMFKDRKVVPMAADKLSPNYVSNNFETA